MRTSHETSTSLARAPFRLAVLASDTRRSFGKARVIDQVHADSEHRNANTKISSVSNRGGQAIISPAQRERGTVGSLRVRAAVRIAAGAYEVLVALAAASWSQVSHAQAARAVLGVPSATDAVAYVARTDFPGQPAAGRDLAQSRCVACHGMDGLTVNFPAYPRLAGQLRGYLYMQLAFFSTGERQHPIMSAQVQDLKNQQLFDLAAYYSALPAMPPLAAAVTASELAVGEKLFREGALDRGIPACAACHGKAGQGQLPAFARIGGQHPQYLQGMLTLFREKREFTTPFAWVMNSVAAKLTPAEIKAVAAYASTLK